MNLKNQIRGVPEHPKICKLHQIILIIIITVTQLV